MRYKVLDKDKESQYLKPVTDRENMNIGVDFSEIREKNTATLTDRRITNNPKNEFNESIIH